jgi:hypothetical protein
VNSDYNYNYMIYSTTSDDTTIDLFLTVIVT